MFHSFQHTNLAQLLSDLSQNISFLFFLGPHPWYREVPLQGSEPAYATASTTRDPSYVFNLHLSSKQRRILFFNIFFVFLPFLVPILRHMEVPRLRVESELQPLTYTRATAIQDPSCVCNLHHSSQQRRVLNPLSEARDQTHVLMDTSRVHYR